MSVATIRLRPHGQPIVNADCAGLMFGVSADSLAGLQVGGRWPALLVRRGLKLRKEYAREMCIGIEDIDELGFLAHCARRPGVALVVEAPDGQLTVLVEEPGDAE
ncbi:hypothetical protein AAFP35_24040 [Gordonia sp. CPCC 206044]|uniref:hypothetical protein n=1 Tax=Gordonia sp. CPCC 206044 TaxID=3140793 RepID=UPI003AF34EE2